MPFFAKREKSPTRSKTLWRQGSSSKRRGGFSQPAFALQRNKGVGNFLSVLQQQLKERGGEKKKEIKRGLLSRRQIEHQNSQVTRRYEAYVKFNVWKTHKTLKREKENILEATLLQNDQSRDYTTAK